MGGETAGSAGGLGGGSHSGLPAIPQDPSSQAAHANQQQQQQQAAKASLKQWWGKFTKQQQQAAAGYGGSSKTSPTSTSSADGFNSKGVFGVSLTSSLKYAGVAISMVGPDGVNQVYGLVAPVPVEKRMGVLTMVHTRHGKIHPNRCSQMWLIPQAER